MKEQDKSVLSRENYLGFAGLEKARLMTVLEFIVFSLRGFIRPAKQAGLYWLRNEYQGEIDEATGALIIRRKTVEAVLERANRLTRKAKLNCEIVWDGRFRNETFIKANANGPVDHCEDWPDGLYGVDPAML